MEHYTNLISEFFNIYNGTLYWAGFQILQYLQWNVILSWFPNSSIFTVERYTELVSELFNIYNRALYWPGFRIFQYLLWNVILTWFPNSSIFIMNRYANPSSGLFGISAKTLRRYSYTPTIPGQDAPRPSPARVLSFFLSVGNISQRERISVRAVAEEGWYNLGPGRGRYCGRVSCLSHWRVLALPQWF